MDHFIGFVKNYMVPKDATDASGGRWMKGPGRKLTDALNSVLNGTTVIADDYGGKALIPGVKKLLAKTGWLDTKVLMFAFDGDPDTAFRAAGRFCFCSCSYTFMLSTFRHFVARI